MIDCQPKIAFGMIAATCCVLTVAVVHGMDWRDGPWAPQPFVLAEHGLNDFSDMGQNVVALPDGRFAVVWVKAPPLWEGGGRGFLQFVNEEGDMAFSQPRVLAESGTGGVWSPAVVSDASGGVVTAFLSRGESDFFPFEVNLTIQRTDSTGSMLWPGMGTEIAVDSADRPYLVADGGGGAFVCFSGSAHTNGGASCQHVGGTGRRLWGQVPLAVSSSENTQRPYGAVSDGDGGIVVVWLELAGDFKEIRAQRFTRNGARMWGDLGARVVVTSLVDEQFVNLRDIGIGADGTGGVFVSYEDSNDASLSARSVWLERLNGDGLPVWSEPIPMGPPGAGSTNHWATATDEAGNVYVLTNSEIGFGHQDCRLTRVAGTGGMPWGSAGVKVGRWGGGSSRVNVKDGLIVVVKGGTIYAYETNGRPLGPWEGRQSSVSLVQDVIWSNDPGVAVSVGEQGRHGGQIAVVGEVRRLAPPGPRRSRERRP